MAKYGVLARVSKPEFGPAGPFPQSTAEQIELWRKAAVAHHRFEMTIPNVPPELIREFEATAMAYRNSIRPLIDAMNEANRGIIRSEGSDLVVVERRKDGRVNIWITGPHDMLSVAKDYGFPEDDPVLVRVIEAWNKRRRGEIAAEEWQTAMMEFTKQLDEAETKRRSGL